jgi:hypothetical protein
MVRVRANARSRVRVKAGGSFRPRTGLAL